jgi:hypothetical protein
METTNRLQMKYRGDASLVHSGIQRQMPFARVSSLFDNAPAHPPVLPALATKATPVLYTADHNIRRQPLVPAHYLRMHQATHLHCLRWPQK